MAAKLATVVAIAGAGAAFLLGRAHGTETATGTSAPAEVVMAPPSLPPTPPAPFSVIEPALPAPSAVAPASPVSVAHAPSPAPHASQGSVAEEVAILRRVSASLRAGDPRTALAGVAEHARRFPNGALAEERDTERIVALCALGRREDATRATERFERAYPSSSHEGRIRAACPAIATAPSGVAP
jgi:hypothetical protein